MGCCTVVLGIFRSSQIPQQSHSHTPNSKHPTPTGPKKYAAPHPPCPLPGRRCPRCGVRDGPGAAADIDRRGGAHPHGDPCRTRHGAGRHELPPAGKQHETDSMHLLGVGWGGGGRGGSWCLDRHRLGARPRHRSMQCTDHFTYPPPLPRPPLPIHSSHNCTNTFTTPYSRPHHTPTPSISPPSTSHTLPHTHIHPTNPHSTPTTPTHQPRPHRQRHPSHTRQGNKAGVMCNGIQCKEGEMCMRGSGGSYCMTM